MDKFLDFVDDVVHVRVVFSTCTLTRKHFMEKNLHTKASHTSHFIPTPFLFCLFLLSSFPPLFPLPSSPSPLPSSSPSPVCWYCQGGDGVQDLHPRRKPRRLCRGEGGAGHGGRDRRCVHRQLLIGCFKVLIGFGVDMGDGIDGAFKGSCSIGCF